MGYYLDFYLWKAFLAYHVVSIPSIRVNGVKHKNTCPWTTYSISSYSNQYQPYLIQNYCIEYSQIQHLGLNTLQSSEWQADNHSHFSEALGRSNYICNILQPGLKIQDLSGSTALLPPTFPALSPVQPPELPHSDQSSLCLPPLLFPLQDLLLPHKI